jgi:fatty acid desaturase
VRPGARLPLRFAADRRSLAFLALFYGLVVVQWLGWARHGTLWGATALLAFVACIVKHNHVHCRTFRDWRWNVGLDHALGLATGHPTSAIVTPHNVRHHRHNQTDRDWVRCSLVRFRWNWLNLACFAVVSVWTMRREKGGDLAAWRRRRPRLYRQAIVERVVLYTVAGGLLGLDWRATLAYLVGPWLVAQWALVTINLLQHQDCDPTSALDHSRNVTGRLVNWLLLNNGFHTAHHVRPALHWSRLPAFHQAHLAPRIRPGLSQRSLAVAVWRQFVVAAPR